jgi:hypothetical protein
MPGDPLGKREARRPEHGSELLVKRSDEARVASRFLSGHDRPDRPPTRPIGTPLTADKSEERHQRRGHFCSRSDGQRSTGRIFTVVLMVFPHPAVGRRDGPAMPGATRAHRLPSPASGKSAERGICQARPTCGPGTSPCQCGRQPRGAWLGHGRRRTRRRCPHAKGVPVRCGLAHRPGSPMLSTGVTRIASQPRPVGRLRLWPCMHPSRRTWRAPSRWLLLAPGRPTRLSGQMRSRRPVPRALR